MLLPPNFKSFPPEIYHDQTIFSARVGNIEDGDTFDCFIHIGKALGLFPWVTIRVWGIDTPELSSHDEVKRKRAKEAKAYLSTLIPIGSPCEIRFLGLDKYKRWVSTITYMKNGILRDVGNDMLASGFADELILMGETVEAMALEHSH